MKITCNEDAVVCLFRLGSLALQNQQKDEANPNAYKCVIAHLTELQSIYGMKDDHLERFACENLRVSLKNIQAHMSNSLDLHLLVFSDKSSIESLKDVAPKGNALNSEPIAPLNISKSQQLLTCASPKNATTLLSDRSAMPDAKTDSIEQVELSSSQIIESNDAFSSPTIEPVEATTSKSSLGLTRTYAQVLAYIPSKCSAVENLDVNDTVQQQKSSVHTSPISAYQKDEVNKSQSNVNSWDTSKNKRNDSVVIYGLNYNKNNDYNDIKYMLSKADLNFEAVETYSRIKCHTDIDLIKITFKSYSLKMKFLHSRKKINSYLEEVVIRDDLTKKERKLKSLLLQTRDNLNASLEYCDTKNRRYGRNLNGNKFFFIIRNGSIEKIVKDY